MADTSKTSVNNYQLALSHYGDVLEGSKLRSEFNEAAGQGLGGLETIANSTQKLIRDTVTTEPEITNYSNGIKKAIDNKNPNPSLLIEMFNQLYQFKYGKTNSIFYGLFSEDNVLNTLDSAPKDFRKSLAFNTFNQEYNGKNEVTHKLIADILYRQDVLLVLSGEKAIYNQDLDRNKIREIADEEHQKTRKPQENQEAEDLINNLDNLLNIPVSDYFERCQEIVGKFDSEELPNFSEYLADSVPKDNLIGFFQSYQQKKEQEKQKQQSQ